MKWCWTTLHLTASLCETFTSTLVTWAGFCLSPSPTAGAWAPPPSPLFWHMCQYSRGKPMYYFKQSSPLSAPKLPSWSPADKGPRVISLEINPVDPIPSSDGCSVLEQLCNLGSAPLFSGYFLGSDCDSNYRHWHRYCLAGTTRLFPQDIPHRDLFVLFCFI